MAENHVREEPNEVQATFDRIVEDNAVVWQRAGGEPDEPAPDDGGQAAEPDEPGERGGTHA